MNEIKSQNKLYLTKNNYENVYSNYYYSYIYTNLKN